MEPSAARRASELPAVARRLADTHGRPVRVLASREDVVLLGPKRPPLAAGVRHDGTGHVRVVRTPGIADAIRAVAPGLEVEEVDVAGPPTSTAAAGGRLGRGRGRCSASLGPDDEVVAPNGARGLRRRSPTTACTSACGAASHSTRSCCAPTASARPTWRSAGCAARALAVDVDGVPLDLTIRSFGILRAVDMPPVDVEIEPDDGAPVNGSDAVFAAVAAAAWRHRGHPEAWPADRR